MEGNNATATEIKIVDTGDKKLETIQEESVKSPSEEQKPTEKKEQKITKCPEDVPTAIFDCLANMTDCERLKLTKDEAQRMSDAITNLFGKHLGGWMWWALVLVVTILSKLSYAWHCLAKKKDKKEQKIEVKKEAVKLSSEEPKEAKTEDTVQVTVNGKITKMSREAATNAGLIKAPGA